MHDDAPSLAVNVPGAQKTGSVEPTAPSSHTPLPAPPPSPPAGPPFPHTGQPNTESGGNDDLNDGEITGIAIAVFAFIFIVVVCVYLFAKQRFGKGGQPQAKLGQAVPVQLPVPV